MAEQQSVRGRPAVAIEQQTRGVGIMKSLAIEPDALILLKAMAPNRKSYGHLLSELLRAEWERREERNRVLAARA